MTELAKRPSQEIADQLELAARIIREGLEWEYAWRGEWCSGKNFGLMFILKEGRLIRIKEQPKFKRVPLGPEDFPPGSVLRPLPDFCWWYTILGIEGDAAKMHGETVSYYRLMNEGWEIKRPGQEWTGAWREVAE